MSFLSEMHIVRPQSENSKQIKIKYIAALHVPTNCIIQSILTKIHFDSIIHPTLNKNEILYK